MPRHGAESYRLHLTSDSPDAAGIWSDCTFRVSIPELDGSVDWQIAVESFATSGAPKPYSIACPNLSCGNAVYTSLVEGSASILACHGAANWMVPVHRGSVGIRCPGAAHLKNSRLNIRFLDTSGDIFAEGAWGAATEWAMTLVLWPVYKK